MFTIVVDNLQGKYEYMNVPIEGAGLPPTKITSPWKLYKRYSKRLDEYFERYTIDRDVMYIQCVNPLTKHSNPEWYANH